MRGERHFTDREVEQIRIEYAGGGVSQMRLGGRWDCEATIIGFIVRGETYVDAPGPITHRGRATPVTHAARPGSPDRALCLEARPTGLTQDPSQVTCKRCRRYSRLKESSDVRA